MLKIMANCDAWGNIRAGNTTGDPKARYVANLGHLADDESGLTYMRARYYEPSSGRFVSEDPAMDGHNWFTYCGNVPNNFKDSSGRVKFSGNVWQQLAGVGLFNAGEVAALIALATAREDPAAATQAIMVAATFFAASLSFTDVELGAKQAATLFRVIFDNRVLRGIASALTTNLNETERLQMMASVGRIAVMAMTIYSIVTMGAFICTMEDL